MLRSLFAAALIISSILVVRPADAFGLCGFGCHISISGACVVDGWGSVRNECPAYSRPVPPCPRGYKFRHRACMPR